MNPIDRLFEASDRQRGPAETALDFRERIAHEHTLAEKRRAQALAEQRNALNSPEVRVKAWEKTHGLRLPVDSQHPVLAVVAKQTGLPLKEIQAELRRAEPG